MEVKKGAFREKLKIEWYLHEGKMWGEKKNSRGESGYRIG